MKPSRIVKSAWKQAGKPSSLKSFARHNACEPTPERLAELPPNNKHSACAQWLAAKHLQSKSAQRSEVRRG